MDNSANQLRRTSLVRYDGFSELLSGQQGKPMSDEEAIQFIFVRGRALLQGVAGSGKSTALRRLSDHSEFASALYSIPALFASWNFGGTRDSIREFVFNAAERIAGEKFLLCLDGLDEVPLAEAQHFLDAAEMATQDDPQLAVVITDRVNRRPVRSDRWALIGVTASADARTNGWAGLPFFDSRSEYAPGGMASEIERMAGKITEGLTAEDFDRIGEAAFTWLKEEDSTTAPLQWVQKVLGGDLFDRLIGEGMLRQDESGVQFAHLLYHAYFAAGSVREDTSAWTDETWNILTLGGANFAALGLLLEQVKSDQVDDVLRSVDQWSYLASATLLADDSLSGRRVSPALRAALLLLLGHRRFSMSPNTDVLASDLLRLQRNDELAERILSTASREELAELARIQPDYGAWWRTWLTLFSGEVSGDSIAQLRGEDYILAWTAANVLAAGQISDPSEEDLLINLAVNDAEPEVRWRAVHALGGSGRIETARAALSIFKRDTDEWARYGALRSFIRVVSRLQQASERVDLLDSLASMSEELQQNPRWLREVERAAELRPAPSDWPTSFATVIEALLLTGESIEDEDRWRTASATLRTTWRPNLPASLRPMYVGGQR